MSASSLVRNAYVLSVSICTSDVGALTYNQKHHLLICNFKRTFWNRLNEHYKKIGHSADNMAGIYVIVLVASCITSAIVGASNTCPPAIDVAPCQCVSEGTNVRLNCNEVTSLESSRRAVSKFQGYQGVVVDFMECEFDQKIPSDFFYGVGISDLAFVDSVLHSIGDEGRPAFLGLENSLKELTIMASFSEEEGGLSFLNISNLRNLEYLEIDDNFIETLGDDWFQNGPRTLEDVYITANSIKSLGRNVFASLPNLRNLWLTGNSFGTVERSMFPRPARHLQSLDLATNKIFQLPADIFSEMPSLTEVVLDGNMIQSLPASTWLPVWNQLHHVYLVGDPLVCDSEMDWMLGRTRPYVLRGYCVNPPERRGKDLDKLIDDGR